MNFVFIKILVKFDLYFMYDLHGLPPCFLATGSNPFFMYFSSFFAFLTYYFYRFLYVITSKFLGDTQNLLQENQYPEYKAHKQRHDSFTKKVAMYKKHFDRAENVDVNEMMGFLKSWLRELSWFSGNRTFC